MGFSPDNSMILFAYDIENVWRHSFTAKYLVLDTSTNKVQNKEGLRRLLHIAFHGSEL